MTPTTSASVRSLSDHELRAALKDYGLSPGPITDSTRELYRKKLESILGDIGEQEDDESTSDEQEDLEDESTDEPFEVDEEELNQSSDSYSEEVEEDEEEEEEEEEKSQENQAHSSPSKAKYYIISVIFLLIVAILTNGRLTRQLLILLSLSPIGYILYTTYRFFKTRRNEENKRVCDLVGEALELLQSPENPKGLMPILHIRDTLLTPAERKAKKTAKIWQKAVNFIEEHESRVKVELVNIDGEDFRAWKWIGSRKAL